MNQDFTIYNAQGEILRTGNCPESDLALQLQAGEFMLRAKASCADDAVDPHSKRIVKGGRVKPPPLDNPAAMRRLRLTAEQQLDLLWQAMDAGTFPKAEPFYSALKAQKTAP